MNENVKIWISNKKILWSVPYTSQCIFMVPYVAFFSIRIYPTCAHGAHKNGQSISLVTNSKMNIRYLLNQHYESLNGTGNWTRTPKIYFGAWIRHFELHYKSIVSMSNNNFLDLVQSKYQKVLKNHLRFF